MKAASYWKARAKVAEAALQLIIEEWNSQGRLIDTFTSDRMNAVIDNAAFILPSARDEKHDALRSTATSNL